MKDIISEKDLDGHITNDSNKDDNVISKKINIVDPEKDYYLYEALNTLKITLFICANI